jgi:hypothetical protein
MSEQTLGGKLDLSDSLFLIDSSFSICETVWQNSEPIISKVFFSKFMVLSRASPSRVTIGYPPCSLVAEHSTHNPEIEGLSPATGAG